MAGLLDGDDVPGLLAEALLEGVAWLALGIGLEFGVAGGLLGERPVLLEGAASDVGALHDDGVAGGGDDLGQIDEGAVGEAVADGQQPDFLGGEGEGEREAGQQGWEQMLVHGRSWGC